jgi:hypothetical protein
MAALKSFVPNYIIFYDIYGSNVPIERITTDLNNLIEW